MPYAALRNMSLMFRERNPDRRIQAGLRTDSPDCLQSAYRTPSHAGPGFEILRATATVVNVRDQG